MGCERVLICGVSTRSAAESAARAGFAVTAIDAFGDLDQHAGVRALSLPRDFRRRFTAAAAALAAGEVECDAVAYLSPFENHPRAVDGLACGRALWGNPAEVLRRVRNPLLLARALRARGLPALAVRTNESTRLRRAEGTDARLRRGLAGARRTSLGGERGRDVSNDPNAPNRSNGSSDPNDPQWILKPVRSGGGHRIRPWRNGERMPRGCYLQQRASGTPGSFLFVAAEGRVAPLGISRQLTGEQSFGATGYRYCGNVVATAENLRFPQHDALVDTLCRIAARVVEEFSLVGINGIDFIARDGVPFTLEVNPRWSGAMEVVERWSGAGLFAAHAAACRAGALPAADLLHPPAASGAVGKAIVFARANVVMGDTRSWLEDEDIRDVPHPRERIGAGQPVCTVFARGRDVAECQAALVRRAETVYEELEMRKVS